MDVAPSPDLLELARREGRPVVVIVDDHRAYANLVVEALSEEAPHLLALAFTRGEAAVEFLTNAAGSGLGGVIRAVFLDLGLPDMTGHAVLSCVRQDAAYQRVPVIVLTNSTAAADVRRSAVLEADAYEVKPDTYEDLLALVRRCRCWLT